MGRLFGLYLGIATDNGVIVCTYLQQIFTEKNPKTLSEIRAATVEAGDRRVSSCYDDQRYPQFLHSCRFSPQSGRGSDIMVPMAIPSFGGMLLAILTIFVVPVLYCGLG